MAQNGKGSKPRPFTVDRDVFRDNWDQTFGKKPEVPKKQPEQPKQTDK